MHEAATISDRHLGQGEEGEVSWPAETDDELEARCRRVADINKQAAKTIRELEECRAKGQSAKVAHNCGVWFVITQPKP